jgi:hypothetical protein
MSRDVPEDDDHTTSPPPDYPQEPSVTSPPSSLLDDRTILRENITEILCSFTFYSKVYLLAALCTHIFIYIAIILVLAFHGNRPCEQYLPTYLIVYLARGIVAELLFCLVYILPRCWQHQRMSITADRRSFIMILEKAKLILDFFFIIWFVVGNWWFYSSRACAITNPPVYYLTFSMMILGYVFLAIPLVLLSGFLCCLPFILVRLRHRPLREPSITKPSGATEAELAALPCVVYMGYGQIIPSYPTFREDDRQCLICLCEYAYGDELRLLPCVHYFHKICIDDWLKMSKTCPLCIQRIDFLSKNEDIESSSILLTIEQTIMTSEII